MKKVFSLLAIIFSFSVHAGGGVYSSNSLGFDIKLAKEFAIQDGAAKLEAVYEGGSRLFGDNYDPTKETFKATVLLLAKTQNNTASVTIAVQPIGLTPGVKTGEDYLKGAKSFMEKGQIKFNFPKPISVVSFGGTEFYQLLTTFDLNNTKSKVESYSRVIEGKVLNFSFTCSNQESCTLVEKTIKSVKFK